MKKLSFLVCIFIFSFLISCKSNEDPKPKPTTLADRAGIYKATSTQNSSQITITLNNDGTGTFVANTSIPVNIALGEPTSTATSFVFYTDNTDTDNTKFTIDFINNTLQSGNYFGNAVFEMAKQQ